MTNGTTAYDLHSDRVEEGLLGAIGQKVNNWLAITSTFGSEDFVKNREVFLFIQQHLAKYESLPSNSQLSASYDFNPPIGPFEYWLDEFKTYVLARRVNSILLEGAHKLGDKKPEEAMTQVIDKLSLLRSKQSNQIQASDAMAGQRLENFDYRTELIFNTNEIVGLKTGIKIIDESQIGWTPGSLVGVYARPSVGKTWWLLWQGAMNWMNGKTILAITPEMPANWLNLRIDVVVGNMLGYPIDYNKLLKGDPSIRPNYELVTKILAQSQRWWTYSGQDERGISLGDIRALIRQHRPDMVLIDGISLLRYEGRGQTWEKMGDLSYGLKSVATTTEVPILITHSAVNSARGRRNQPAGIAGRGDDDWLPSLNDAAYGDSFVFACSDVLTMAPEPQDRNIIWYRIAKHRERGWERPLPDRMGMACDFAFGKIYDLSELGYSPSDVGLEARRLLGK